MASWRTALSKTRAALARVLGRSPDANAKAGAAVAGLEDALLLADVAPALAAAVCQQVARDPAPVDAMTKLAGVLESMLPPPAPAAESPPPRTVVVVGTNGSGKTTTCAKLARRVQQEGRRPLLCAADTFRAAGADQLRLWATRLGCDVVAGGAGADPAAVAFDALDAAIARRADALFIDTAGRMHTREPLMRELEKIRRALAKRKPAAPEDTWLVMDATLGRNAVAQAGAFAAATPLTGVVVAKLDGSARGGFVFSLARDLGLPILYAGLGEGPDDLVPFDRRRFVRGLLGIDDDDGGNAADG